MWNLDNNITSLELTDNVINIMKQQCNYLKEETGGKVFAKFAKIKKISQLQLAAQSLFTGYKLPELLTIKEMVGDEDTSDLVDANELYNKNRYGFEVYNKTYKFRIFELQMEPVYPIRILLDEGIDEEIKGMFTASHFKSDDNPIYTVNSDDEFISYLKAVINSKKVTFIVSKMLSISE